MTADPSTENSFQGNRVNPIIYKWLVIYRVHLQMIGDINIYRQLTDISITFQIIVEKLTTFRTYDHRDICLPS